MEGNVYTSISPTVSIEKVSEKRRQLNTGGKSLVDFNSELAKAMKEINKRYGDGTIDNASNAKALTISRIPTGSFSLDVETGGGIPEDRITVIAGPYSSSKTTTALKIAAQAQKKYPERKVLWVDAEGAFDKEWAVKNGVDLDRIIIVRPQYMEQAMDIVDALVQSEAICLVIIDSIAAMIPSREMEGSMEDNQMGLNALLNSKFMRKVTSSMRRNKALNQESHNPITLVILNQLREKIGAYGNPETMPGGKALEFYASVIIYIRRGEWKVLKTGGREEMIGQECKFKVDKNKTFAPKRQGSFDLYFKDSPQFGATQIDRIKEVVTYAVLWDVVVRKGGWYYVGEDKFQGADALLEHLRSNPEALAKVEEVVMELATRGKTHIIEDGKVIDPDTGEVIEE